MEIKHKKMVVTVLILFFVCLAVVRVYNSPAENHRYEDDVRGTIEAGRWFSHFLYIGAKDRLLTKFDFTDRARAKLEKANIQQVFSVDILQKYKAGGGKHDNELKHMLYTDPEGMKLVVLERQRDFLAMTYTLKDCPTVPGRGKMLCSIVFRYYEPANEYLWKRILRKAANAVPFFSSLGTTGRWLVVDYSYTYNQSDYAAWYLREGDAVSGLDREENMAQLKKLATKEGLRKLVEDSELALAVSEEWASAWVERHPEHIDEVLFEEAKRARNEVGVLTR